MPLLTLDPSDHEELPTTRPKERDSEDEEECPGLANLPEHKGQPDPPRRYLARGPVIGPGYISPAEIIARRVLREGRELVPEFFSDLRKHVKLSPPPGFHLLWRVEVAVSSAPELIRLEEDSPQRVDGLRLTKLQYPEGEESLPSREELDGLAEIKEPEAKRLLEQVAPVLRKYNVYCTPVFREILRELTFVQVSGTPVTQAPSARPEADRESARAEDQKRREGQFLTPGGDWQELPSVAEISVSGWNPLCETWKSYHEFATEEFERKLRRHGREVEATLLNAGYEDSEAWLDAAAVSWFIMSQMKRVRLEDLRDPEILRAGRPSGKKFKAGDVSRRVRLIAEILGLRFVKAPSRDR